MVSHRSDDSDVSGFFQFLAFYEGVIKVVALSLLPDVMWSIVPSPQNKVDIIHLGHLFYEQLERLERQVAVAQWAPVAGRGVSWLSHR